MQVNYELIIFVISISLGRVRLDFAEIISAAHASPVIVTVIGSLIS